MPENNCWQRTAHVITSSKFFKVKLEIMGSISFGIVICLDIQKENSAEDKVKKYKYLNLLLSLFFPQLLQLQLTLPLSLYNLKPWY